MQPAPVSRRAFLKSSALVAAAVGSHPVALVQSQATRDYTLTARPSTVDVGPGRPWATWMYNGQFPGPEIRVREGERLRVTLENRLPEPTTIHWHGLPVPNGMDGVPGVTQPAVAPNESFTYEFVAGPAGTYFYHSHVGLQLDRGLVGPLIVEEADPFASTLADRELVVMLDDWLEGAPEAALEQTTGGPHGGGMGGRAGMMGTFDGPAYAGFLINGRVDAREPIRLGRGDRVRLRIVNASAATTFRLGVTGHRLLVTHADGQAVDPVEAGTLTIGMGERYDVLLRGDTPGAWWLVAGPADTSVPSHAVPVTYQGYESRVAPIVWPAELQRGHRLSYADLRSTATVPRSAPGRIIPLTLAGGMPPGTWTINGQAWPNVDPIRVRRDERVRLAFANMSPVRHPMHLHGHFFDVATRGGRGPTKDTVIVEPMMGRVDVDFTADNPGRWLMHCHHAYHMEMGMMRVVEVV